MGKFKLKVKNSFVLKSLGQLCDFKNFTQQNFESKYVLCTKGDVVCSVSEVHVVREMTLF